MNKLNREIQNIETELNKCKELYDRHSQMFANKTEEYRLYLKVINYYRQSKAFALLFDLDWPRLEISIIEFFRIFASLSINFYSK